MTGSTGTGGGGNRVEMEFDIGGDAAEQMKKLADETERLAEAEESYQKLLARRRQMLAPSGRRTPDGTTPDADARQQNRVQSGLARQRVREDGRAQREEERAQQQRQRVQSGLLRQKAQEEDRQRRADSRAKAQDDAKRRREYAQSDEGVVRRRVERAEQEKRVAARMGEAGYGRAEKTVEQEAEERAAKMYRADQVKGRLAAMGLGPREKRAETVDEEANRKMRRMDRDEEVKARMKAAGYEPREPSTAAEIGREVVAAAGVPLGRAAMIGAAVHAARGALSTAGEVSTNPYANKDVALLQAYRQYTFGVGDAATDAINLASGRGQMVRDATLQRDKDFARQPAELARTRADWEFQMSEGAARDTARDSRRLNPLAALPDSARATATEQRRYSDATRLLAVEDRVTKAKREQFEVSQKMVQAKRAMDSQDDDLKVLEKDRKGLESQKKWLDETTLLNPGEKEIKGRKVAADMLLNERAVEENRAAHLRYTQEWGQARQDNERAIGRVRDTELGRGAERQYLLQEREQTAAGQSANLSLAGPAGRQTALAYKQAADLYGIENLPPEMSGTVMQYFPKEGGAMAERGGQQFVPEFRRAGGEDYRDSLPDIRAEVDKAKEEQRKHGEEIAQLLLDGILGAFDGMGEAMFALRGKIIEDAWKKALAEKMFNPFGQR